MAPYDVAIRANAATETGAKLVRILVRVGVFGRPYADVVRDLDVIDSELRLLAAVRRTALEDGGTAPRIDLIDGLLDERRAVVSGRGD